MLKNKKTKMTTEQPFDSRTGAERAQRIKEARLFAGYRTQEAFCKKHPDIPLATLKAWEAGTNAPLSTQGAKRLYVAFRESEVIVTPGWLLRGEEPGPHHVNKNLSESSLHNLSATPVNVIEKLTQKRSALVLQELLDFMNKNPSAVYMQIDDDSLEPLLQKGDYVCGEWLEGDDLKLLRDRVCIVLNEQNDPVCRKLKLAKNEKWIAESWNTSAKIKPIHNIHKAA